MKDLLKDDNKSLIKTTAELVVVSQLIGMIKK